MHSAHCICNFILAHENLKTGFLACTCHTSCCNQPSKNCQILNFFKGYFRDLIKTSQVKCSHIYSGGCTFFYSNM